VEIHARLTAQPLRIRRHLQGMQSRTQLWLAMINFDNLRSFVHDRNVTDAPTENKN
jgi:hypothetical protein